MRKIFQGVWFAVLLFALISTPVYAQKKTPQTHGRAIIEAIRIKGPLSFCNEPVPLTDPDVRERLERELLISLDNSDSIILWLKRANRYFPHIEKALKEQSMPDDLKYIAIAESSLRPLVFSYKGAVGYWQFIESTGSKYGLEINKEMDERRNFYKATEAALTYLKDLHAMFDSWTMAAAAYNMGEDGLKAEVMVQKVNDYYKLYLNQETHRYVFRILAAKIIISNPAKFGYVLKKSDFYLPRSFDVVEITVVRPVPLYIIAQAANTYHKVIKDLNPQIRLYHLPAGTHLIHIPKGAAEGFSARYAKLVDEWIQNKDEYVYTVKKGDSLTAIADRFDVPLKALLIWNGIGSRNIIKPGETLYIFSDNVKAADAPVKTDQTETKDKPANKDPEDPTDDSVGVPE